MISFSSLLVRGSALTDMSPDKDWSRAISFRTLLLPNNRKSDIDRYESGQGAVSTDILLSNIASKYINRYESGQGSVSTDILLSDVASK